MKIDEILFNIVARLQGSENGTAFYIDENTLMTAYHVVKNEQKQRAKVKIINDTLGDNEIFGEVCEYDETLDIALIKIDKKINIPKIKLSIRNIYEGEEWRSYTCFEPYDESKNIFEKEMIKGKIYQNEEFRGQVYDIHLDGEYLSKAGMYNGFCGSSGTPLVINDVIVGIIIKEERSERDTPLKAASFNKFREFFMKNKITYEEDEKLKLVKKSNISDVFKIISSDKLVAKLNELPTVNFLYDEYNNNTNIVIPSNISTRKNFVYEIIKEFNEYDVLNIYGFICSGKSILAALIANKIDKYKLYVDLRGVQSNNLTKYINDIFKNTLIKNNVYDESENIIEQICKLINVNGILILDNFENIRRSDKSFIYIYSLLSLCKKYNMKVIVISSNTIENLKLQSNGIKLLLKKSENLNKDDIAEIFESYKLRYSEDHINFIYGITGGNPSLVYALFCYLKENDWRLIDKFDGIFNGEFVGDLKDDMQFRIVDLIEDEDVKELLYRIALINFPYDIKLIEKLAKINPNISHVNEKLTKLIGMINKSNQIYSNVVLLDKVAEKNLDHEVQINVHKIIVQRIFETHKSLDYINFHNLFLHLVKAEEDNQAGLLLCSALNDLNDSDLNKDYWNILDLWNDIECPESMNIEIKLYLCVLQILCCDKFNKNNENLFLRLDKYLKEIINDGHKVKEKLLVIALLSVHYSLKNVSIALKYLKVLIECNANEIFEKYKNIMEMNEEFKFEQVFFLCSASIKTKDERELFFSIYDRMDSKQRQNFNSLDDIYDASLSICSKVWLTEVNGEGDFNKVINELIDMKSKSICVENKWFYINIKKCEIIVYGEYLGNIDEAEKIAKEVLISDLCKEKSIEFLIKDVIAKQFSINRDDNKAKEYLESISLEFEGFDLEKIDYLNQYSIVNSNINDHKLAIENLINASKLIYELKLPCEVVLKNLGETAIEYWINKDYVNMYKVMKKFIELIENVKSEHINENLKSLVVCLGHCTGYYSSFLATGKGPQTCSDENSYVEPKRGMFINDDGNKDYLYDENKSALIYAHMGMIAEVLKIYDDSKEYYERSVDIYKSKDGIKGLLERYLLKYEIVDCNYEKAFNLTISEVKNIFLESNAVKNNDNILFDIGNAIFNDFIIPVLFNILKKYIEDDKSYINDSLELIELLKKQNYINNKEVLLIEDIINNNIVKDNCIIKSFSKSNKYFFSLQLIEYISLTKIYFKNDLRQALNIQFAFIDYLKKIYSREKYVYNNIIKTTLLNFWIYAYCRYRVNFNNTEMIDRKLSELISSNEDNMHLEKILNLMKEGLI